MLEILKEMQVSIKSLDEGQKEIKLELNEINKKLDGVVNQTAYLTEFRTTVLSKLEDINVVEEVTKANCYDIAKLKAIR